MATATATVTPTGPATLVAPPAATPGTAERAPRGDRNDDPVHDDPLGRRPVRRLRRDHAPRRDPRRDDEGHHPLRPGDDGLLRRAGRDLRDHRGATRRGRRGPRLYRGD